MTLAVCAVTFACAAAGASARSRVFFSPSFNIQCVVGSRYGALCTVYSRRQQVHLTQCGRTHVRPLRSNPQIENVPVLRYGHSVRVGRITCTSLRRGMRCRARPSGHGFLAARGGIRRF
jgi:uncharacterized protein DUF6636